MESSLCKTYVFSCYETQNREGFSAFRFLKTREALCVVIPLPQTQRMADPKLVQSPSLNVYGSESFASDDRVTFLYEGAPYVLTQTENHCAKGLSHGVNHYKHLFVREAL